MFVLNQNALLTAHFNLMQYTLHTGKKDILGMTAVLVLAVIATSWPIPSFFTIYVVQSYVKTPLQAIIKIPTDPVGGSSVAHFVTNNVCFFVTEAIVTDCTSIIR